MYLHLFEKIFYKNLLSVPPFYRLDIHEYMTRVVGLVFDRRLKSEHIKKYNCILLYVMGKRQSAICILCFEQLKL